MPFDALDLVAGQRIAPGAWYLVDDLIVTGGEDLSTPHDVEPLPQPFTLWTGPPIPDDVESIPFVPDVEHRTIHQASEDGYKFLHGAAIVQRKGVLFANWANSPVNENGPHETLQGRRSSDGGVTWSELEVIGSDFAGPERHSHGVLFVHKGELWTICARFGVGTPGRRFPGLQAEAFVLDEQTDRWNSRGTIVHWSHLPKSHWPVMFPDETSDRSNGQPINSGIASPAGRLSVGRPESVW